MSTISTHILDTARGCPAAGVPITLERQSADASSAFDAGWQRLGGGTTDDDGRVRTLLEAGNTLDIGTYRMTFDTASYFHNQGITGFYPVVYVLFVIQASDEHYHVPLLLSPYGYSTYRGS